MMEKSNRKKIAGFSLVEMLVVLTVVGILLAFAAPNVFSLVQARTLTGEGSLLRNQLTYGQQIAVSKNADVEVRFFRWNDAASVQDDNPAFSAFQLFQYDSVGELQPVSAFFRIKGPSAISDKFSTLLVTGKPDKLEKKYGYTSPREGEAPAPLGIGGRKVDTEFVSFRFRPDGSTDLPHSAGKDTWYITLVQGVESAGASRLPDNYVCLQVNPYNGSVTEFRPDL